MRAGLGATEPRTVRFEGDHHLAEPLLNLRTRTEARGARLGRMTGAPGEHRARTDPTGDVAIAWQATSSAGCLSAGSVARRWAMSEGNGSEAVVERAG